MEKKVNNEKVRIYYLDYLKAIAITLVVFCHYVWIPDNSFWGNVLMLLAWSAVPCFFMVTGGLMHCMKDFVWKKYIRKILRTYIGLSAWKAIYLICFGGIQKRFAASSIVGYLFFFDDLEGINTDSMWFMSAYIAVMIFYPISYYLIQSAIGMKLYIYIMILLLFGGMIIPTLNYWIYYIGKINPFEIPNASKMLQLNPFGNYSHMLFYFLLGGIIFKYRNREIEWFKRKKKEWISTSAILIGLFGLVVAKYVQTGSLKWMNIYLESGYSHIFTLVLSVGIYFFVMNLKDSQINYKIGKIIGRNTMGIYYMHIPAIYVINQMVSKAGWEHNSLLSHTIRTVLVVVICSCLTIFIKKIPVIKRLV